MQTPHALDPTLGWILVLVLGVAWVWLGRYWGKKASDTEGFMVAGRNVGLALGAATTMATWVTSNTIMLAPKFAWQMGVWGLVAYSTASFGLFLFAPVAERIQTLMPAGYTSGDFVRVRYGRVAWALFLTISGVYSMAWLVSMAIAGGVLLESLAGLPYLAGMSLILLVCVLYTLFGGMFAVIGTDFVQSVIIQLGLVAIGVTVLVMSDLGAIYNYVELNQPKLIDVWMPVALLSLFNNMFFGFGEVFHNNVWWSRAFAMRKGVARRAFVLSGFLWLPIPVCAGFVGLASGALGLDVTDPDAIGPQVASFIVGPVGTVGLFIVVFCSLASSIDSLLAATSDLLTEDIFRKLLEPDAVDAQVRRASMAFILGLGAVTWTLAAWRPGGLLEVLFFSGPLVASTIWPIVAGVYWSKASKPAAVLAMASGSIIGLVSYFQLGWFTASLISAAISMSIVVSARWLLPGRFDWAELAEGEVAS